MGNKTTEEVEQRRNKVRRLVAQGYTCASKIATNLGIDYTTAKKDISIVRRRMMSKLSDKKVRELTSITEAGYLTDIEEIDELIQRCKAEERTIAEMESGGDSQEELNKSGHVIRRKLKKYGISYGTIIGLIRAKLQARQQLAELYGIVKSGKDVNLNLGISAEVGITMKEIKDTDDRDIIATAEAILKRAD